MLSLSPAVEVAIRESLGGLANGAIYGAKIRAPHALVMAILFRRQSLLKMLRSIAQLTYTHSRNLAAFALLYKALSRILRFVHNKRSPTVPGAAGAAPRDSMVFYAIAGFVGGYIIWGKNNPVNSQINMYLLSRILFGLAKQLGKTGYVPNNEQVFPIFAGFIWMFVMTMFEMDSVRPDLQPSLVSSMQYIYHDSNKFKSLIEMLQDNRIILPIAAAILTKVL